ncbi:hypothetical protein ILUMI_17409 [Ignelater luminosus]|uniref:Uncharacterized protein n=1 Tax=Ignelater luminosus TaxID=2038154 RepID=A0A8K0G7B1_IGNLU|nr:hypothetical protein ILUMI_17409 [Ignelater luminosus]
MEPLHVSMRSYLETFGPWDEEAVEIINIIDDIITQKTGDQRSKAFLEQRISNAIQNGNAAAEWEPFPVPANTSECL